MKDVPNLIAVLQTAFILDTFFLNTGHLLFLGVSHDLSNISYYPPSCSSLVSHPYVAWPILINVSAVRCRFNHTRADYRPRLHDWCVEYRSRVCMTSLQRMTS